LFVKQVGNIHQDDAQEIAHVFLAKLFQRQGRLTERKGLGP